MIHLITDFLRPLQGWTKLFTTITQGRPIASANPGLDSGTPLGMCVKLSQGVPRLGVILAFSDVVAAVADEGFVQGSILLNT